MSELGVKVGGFSYLIEVALSSVLGNCLWMFPVTLQLYQ